MKGLEKLPHLLATNEWSAAEKILRRAVQTRPDAPLLYNLGRVLMEKGDWTQAAHWLGRAVKADSAHQAAWFELGRTSLELADLTRASTAFGRAFALDRADADAARNLGRVALRLGDWSVAKDAYATLDDRDIEAACALYRIAAETGSTDAADRRARLLARRDARADVLKTLTRTAKGTLPLNL